MNKNWKQKARKSMTRALAGFVGVAVLATSLPLSDPAFAQENQAVKVNHNDIAGDKAKFVNALTPVQIARPEEGKSAADFVKEPAQPDIYTLRTDYKAEKGEKYSVNYQPYVASVGARATPAEKAKVNKEITLPDMAGYKKPDGIESFTNSYDAIVDAAKDGHKTGDAANGFKYLALNEYKYKAISNTVMVKHVFQDMDDFNKYTNKDGTITKNDGTFIAKDGTEKKYDLSNEGQKEQFQTLIREHETMRTLLGNTGSTLEVQALEEHERPGFEPQVKSVKTQVPEDTSEFKIEYRYNRAHYDVVFDTKEGTPLPTRTYYYDQEIPKLDTIPTKLGSEFLGWKPSHDLYGADGTKYEKDKIIKDSNGHAIVDLGNTFYKRDGSGKLVLEDGEPVKATNTDEIKLKMPALKLGNGVIPREKLTFTAEWKDKEKAGYAVQFWAEKADHADDASLLEKYDYMGTHVYKDAPTGTRPDLAKEPVKGVVFPDLDQARLDKIWAGYKFDRGTKPYINKFYVYNKDLTAEENKDKNQPTLVKSVSATGKTVYNIYFDRQVYDLYFTQSNYFEKTSPKETFYPSIYKPDGNGGAKQVGGPGAPYHYKARFNQLMLGWPNDAMQTKGFTPGWQSYGWGPNYFVPAWPTHLDTPPYRLNADEFLDMAAYESQGGYAKKIDKGDGTSINLGIDDFTTLSFGIKQGENSIPHHMDFWMDGFKDGETIIRYDLYRSKADTNSKTYGHKASKVQGFKAKKAEERTEFLGEYDVDDKNDERNDVTPFPDKKQKDMYNFERPIGKMAFINAFFNNADDYGDPVKGDVFKRNGYLKFEYTRNKYPLRFNYDPSKIKGDDEFFYPGTEEQNKKANALETFYEFPLKVLSPDLVKDLTKEEKKAGKKPEYFKDDPANLLDNPNNLYKLGLYDLLQRDKTDPSKFFQDEKGNYRVKRPEGLSDQMVFKGWALDPAGTKLVSGHSEKMPSHAMNLYAKWGEPDSKWKVTIDPNGGKMAAININDKVNDLTTERKTIKEKEGDGDQEIEKTYPRKEANDGKKQVFTVVQRQKLKALPKPERYGYDFLGWEVIRYTRDESGNYTDTQDTSYRDRYKVPELYAFGSDVVSPIYLKAIWVENKRADVEVYHYYLKSDFSLDTSKYPNPEKNTLDFKRVGDYVPATGEKQDEHWILANHNELLEKLHGTYKGEDLNEQYKEYNDRVKLNNTFFQSFRVKENINEGTEDNPVYKPNPENIFRFYYRPFRTRDYKVNYIDARGKAEVDAFFKGLDLTDIDALKKGADYKSADDKEKEALLKEANIANKEKFEANRGKLEKILEAYQVIDKEAVTSGARHYDARNFRHIPGWTLVGKPQQQLFYDVNEDTNEFLGINGTGSDEIYFYYKDARAIEVKNPKDKTPEGYVRVTFKIDDKHKGGVFKDKDGKEVTELHYDVIKGLKSNNLPHPIIWKGGKDDKGKAKVKEANRYYITPDQGKTFKGWDNDKWLNDETEINKNYTFTAYFDWSGLTTSSTGLVRTEAYKDPNGTWTNDFAPKIADLKAQLVWKGKNGTQTIPEGTDIKFVYKDDAGTETVLNSDKDLFNLVKEMNVEDKDQTVRVLNIVARVTFKGGDATKPQELPIPITVYKNRYEALNEKGDKPKYLSDAEGKEAKDGGLKDVTGNYIMVTVSPTGDMEAKDNKVYYVNPNAWVEIPEVKADGSSTFINWTADQVNQNDDGKENGVFDFGKRHKFTKDTVITPVGAGDVVEQEKGKDKPDVPKAYVKVIVKTTDKATDETAFEKTFWVNPKADVTIDVTNPTGKTVAADPAKPGTVGYTMNFFKWQTEDKSKAWEGKIAGKFEKDTTILAKYSIEFEKIKDLTPKTDAVPTPKGKIPTVDEIKAKITPPEGKTIKEVKIVKDPDVNTPGDSKVQVIVEYTDGSSVGTNDNPIEVPVKVHDPIVKGNPDGSKPEGALENYVKVTFTAGEGGSVSGDLVYYVSPEVEVNMTDPAGKITKTPNVGYYVNGEKWAPEIKSEKITTEKTYFFNFDKSDNIVEKTDDPSQKIPEGYVKVTFKTEDANKGKIAGDKLEKVYYVNPKAGITLKVLGKGETATDKQLAVPAYTANTNYTFLAWQEAIDESTPITSDRTHVAIFQSGQVTLTYDKGGKDVEGNAPKPVTVNVGETVGLANKETLKKPNHEFAGWKLDDDDTIYQPGTQVKLEKARTATAQWTASQHKVTFNTMGGTKVPDQTVEHGKTLKKVDNPKRDGKVFMGWKEEGKEGLAGYFDLTSPITDNKTLVAQWQEPVQKINNGDTVEDQFIKVTFKQGDHGQLVPDKDKQDEKVQTVTYKVAKDSTFGDAVKHGLVVPGIQPAKFYKAADSNKGWDKALDLTLATGETEKIFTAQYELEANVIPVDPKKDDEILKQEKPEGMVLVVFKVPEDKAFMTGDTKFYVKKSELVNIAAPKVRPLTLKDKVNDYQFKGWGLITDGVDKVSFTEDTTIKDATGTKPDIRIRNPRPNAKLVVIQQLTDGATGYLEVTRNGQTTTIKSSKRGKMNVFNLSTLDGKCVKEKDLLKFYAEKGSLQSVVRDYRVR